VTGASSGIGKAISKQLASEGVNIVAVARNNNNLDLLKTELTVLYNIEVKTIAGIENNGLFSDNELESEEQLLALNISSPMILSHTFSSRFAKRGAGGIILVSSLFGYQGVPLVANYSASKAYILALGEALNVELKPQGIDVTVLSPGLTQTPMSEKMAINFNKMPITQHAPEYVAQIGLSALGHKPTVVPGLMNKIYAWENRFIPRSWPVKLFGHLIKRALVEKTTYPQKKQPIQSK